MAETPYFVPGAPRRLSIEVHPGSSGLELAVEIVGALSRELGAEVVDTNVAPDGREGAFTLRLPAPGPASPQVADEMPDLEIVPAWGHWLLQAVGAQDALSMHESVEAALEVGRTIARARAVDLVIREGAGRPRVERFSLERHTN